MIQQKTLPELLKFKAFESSEEVCHWVREQDNFWMHLDFRLFYQEVVDVAWKLKFQGIDKGCVAAIMATTSREWELINHAVLAIGGVVVGVDPNETAEQLNGIIGIASVQVLIVDRVDRLNKIDESTRRGFKSIIVFGDETLEYKGTNLLCLYMPKPKSEKLKKDPLPNVVGTNDVATIIFTSGTSGEPKGIAYRHGQIIAAVNSILSIYPELFEKPCRLICWLPLSNLFQRIVNFCAIASGAEVYFVSQPQKIIEYLPEINPHIFIAVPRFYEKLYQGFESKLAQQPKIIARCLRSCLAAGESDSLAGKLFRKLNFRLFGSFVSLFGNNIRYMISGSAPMPLWLLKRFNAMGLLILEAYGLSENVVPIAANRPTDYCFGSVGKVLNGNSIALAEDGELLVKGVGVFNGYLGDQQHERSLNDAGYLATGDYAEIDTQGFIRLTGRKSEVFKTSTGRKIAPVAIESTLQNNSVVEHAVVFGESRKFLVALITVGVARPVDDAAILDFVQQVAGNLAHSMSDLPIYKCPVGCVLSFKSLSVEGQELTTNLKLRRKNIQKRYGEWIDRLYIALDDSQSVIHRQPVLINSEIVLFKL